MNRNALHALVAAALLAGAGTSLAADIRDIAASKHVKVSIEQAIDTALKVHPGSIALDADLDGHKDDTMDYDVRVVTTSNHVFKVRIDPITGEVIRDKAQGPRITSTPSLQISLKQAIITAQQQHPGSKALNAYFDGARGTPRYVIETLLPTGELRELTIDAQSGQVMEDHPDRADY